MVAKRQPVRRPIRTMEDDPSKQLGEGYCILS
jgi:hypothetical protein